MSLELEKYVRWLLLLLIVPLVSGQGVLSATGEVSTQLDTKLLVEFIPASGTDATSTFVGPACGSDHFTFDSTNRWFKYRESEDGIGCAEARFAVNSPEGTKTLGVTFQADREINFAPADIAPTPSFQQNLRLYSNDPEPAVLKSQQIFGQNLPEAKLENFYLQMVLPSDSRQSTLAWHFQENVVVTTIARSPLTATYYASFVSQPVVVHEGISLTTTEQAGATRVTDDTEYVESIIAVKVPEHLFAFGDVQVKLLLPKSYNSVEVVLPSGKTVQDALIVETVETGIQLTLPAEVITGPGTYEFKVERQTPLQQSTLMWPFAGFAMLMPLIAGVFAIRETKRFQENAGASSKATANALGRGNLMAMASIILLEAWLLLFGRVKLLTVLPLQLEGTLYYVLLVALAIGGFSIWFLTRYRLRELEMDMERLEELSTVKSQMIGTMSHELRSPLTPMKMELDMLESGFMGDLSKEQKESVHTLQMSLKRLNHLVADILDVSKSDSGQLKIIPAQMDLVNSISGILDTLSSSALTKKVDLIYNGPKEFPIEADVVRLEQVFTNLIDNAIKFTPASGKITIEAIDEGTTAFISITDSGQGMPLDNIRKLFQPFGQIHADAQTNRTGTGLGLYICKGIIEGHGGTILGASEGLGKGSTFEIRIPKKSGHKFVD